MEKPETRFRRKVVKWIKENLNNTVVFSLQQLSLIGDPDLILCCSGLFVALEIKSEKGRLSALQAHKLGLIKSKGLGYAFEVNPFNFKTVQELLISIEKRGVKIKWENQ